MKRRTEIILAVVVLAGLAAVSSVKRGGKSGACTGGSCCVPLPGLSALGTNYWPGAVATNQAVAPTAERVVSNAEQ